MVNVRRAFSLIELIFAIVLIAIVVMAVPQMIAQNEKGTEQYLKQEVIAAAAGEAFRILSYPWDTNSLGDTNRSFILDASTSGNLARRSNGLPVRIGGVPPIKNAERYYHRRFFNTVTAPADSNLSGSAFVDASLLTERDTNGYKETYTISFPANQNGYVSDGNGSTSYVFNTANSGQSNMKMATVQVNSSSENNIMRLRVYAANIGNAEYFTRTF